MIRFLICLGILLSAVARADVRTTEFHGETYKLILAVAPKRSKDPIINVYAVPNETKKEETKTLELMRWPKKKYPDLMGRDWIQPLAKRLVQPIKRHVNPADKDDVIFEVVTFFSMPAGQEVTLRRFFYDPEHPGVTSYSVRWGFLEHEGQVNDAAYREHRDELLAELWALKIPLELPEAKKSSRAPGGDRLSRSASRDRDS